MPVLRFKSQRSVLGGAANTAANVASLGGEATLIGGIGTDDAGNEVQRLCGAANGGGGQRGAGKQGVSPQGHWLLPKVLNSKCKVYCAGQTSRQGSAW